MLKQFCWTWPPLQALEVLQKNLDRENCESIDVNYDNKSGES